MASEFDPEVGEAWGNLLLSVHGYLVGLTCRHFRLIRWF